MMHTVVSLYDVFSDGYPAETIVERHGNCSAEYIKYNGEKRLHRLFSTVPSDYLNII